MNKVVAIIFTLIFIGCCITANSEIEKDGNMKVLTIRWQRLVYKNGQTCQRCGSTEKELQKAFQSLKQSLAPLRIRVILEKESLDPATCAKDVSQSNRIWIGGRPLEEWLKAEVGQSPCETCCAELGSNVECRTVEVEGQAYEEIPADLIIKAGLLAASQLFTPKIPSSSCCPQSNSNSKECK